MDLVPIVFLAVLVLVGGFVAYLGDNLGRKLGKKRLSFGRLRPKHTAALGTFIAGALGTLLTILILSALSEQVRVWILRGRQAETELNQKTRTLDAKQKELNNLKTALSQTQGDLGSTNTKLDSQSKKLQAETARVKIETNRAAALNLQTKNLAGQIKGLQGQAILLKRSASDLRSSLLAVKSELMMRKAEVAKVRADGQRIAADNAQVSSENLRLTNINRTYQNSITALQNDLAQLKETGNQLQKKNQDLTEKNRVDLQQAQATLDKAKRDLQDAQALLKTLNASAGKFFLDTRLHRLTVNINDELARIDVPAGATRVEANGIFLAALRSAKIAAKKMGAVKGMELDVLKLVDAKGLTEDAIAGEASAALSGQTSHRLLILRAAANTFEGEAALAIVEIHPNRVIYAQNTLIDEVTLDGRLSEEKIADRISEFVRDELSLKAVKDGMIPATGQDSPLGEITSEQILNIVATVKGASRFVRVQFIATQDIRAGDRMKVRISYR